MLLRSALIGLNVLFSLGFAVPGFADQASFDKAVAEYLKGFKACSAANKLRSSDLPAATKKFNFYLKQLDLASAIDESILTSKAREMDSNIRYCQRVEGNLKRAEATPILQHGFGYCEQAEAAYKKGAYEQARKDFDQYKLYKDQAYSITQTLDEVFILSSKVRGCMRLEKKIAKQESQLAARDTQLQQRITKYETFNTACEKTKKFVAAKGFGVDQLDKANKLFNAALQQNVKEADVNKNLQAYIKKQPKNALVKKYQGLQKSTRKCERWVTERIRKVSQRQSSMAAKIQQGNQHLQKALQSCERAGREVDQGSLDLASKLYQRSSASKRKAVRADVVKLVKAHGNWQSVGEYNGLLRKTKDCHLKTAAAIKTLQRKQRADAQAKASARAAAERRRRQALRDAEKQRKAELARKARLEAERKQREQQRLAAEAAKQKAAAAKLKAKPASKPVKAETDVDKWGDEDLFVDDDLKLDSDKKQDKHSWTDIIR